MNTLIIIESRIKKCWSPETSSPALRDRWSTVNPSAGQSDITALVVNDYFGGEIKECHVHDDTHYFNFIDGKIIDLTRSQFGKTPIDYADSIVTARPDILTSPDTVQRYKLLIRSLKLTQK